MRVLVTGAAGMLGSSLVPTLAGAGHDVHPTDLRRSGERLWGGEIRAVEAIDVRSREEVAAAFARVRPELVAHLAAETDLEVCEADPDLAYATNSLGTKHVALAARDAGIPIVYISTAGVFDGAKAEPYTEYDDANPINRYGQSKLVGERYVATFSSRFFIVRAGWMVGGGDRDHKFVAKILQQLEAGARVIRAVDDRLGTPTYAPDFSRCLVALIATGSHGLYHMASTGRASRYDVAQHILRVLGRDDVKLEAVSSHYFRDTYPAPRPQSEMMRNLLLDLQGLNTMRPWQVALEEYLRTAFADLRAATPRRSAVG